MNVLPDIPNDTFLGLSPNLSDLLRVNGIAGVPQLDPMQTLASMQPILGLSSMLGQQRMPQQTGSTAVGNLPAYDGWTLPKGTARGVLNPLPSYKVGTGPTMASMNYTTPNVSWANPKELARMPAQYEPYVQEAARLYHMDPNLIKAIMRAESNYNPNDVSSAGAVGLMQLMKSTAIDAGITPEQRTDPRMNILAATRYIRNIYDKYQNWPLTLAAYNAGPNRREIRSGYIPNIPETRDYVRRVLGLWGMEW